MIVKDKRITVIGLARSGVGAANLLSKLGGRVTVTDKKSEAELAGSLRNLEASVQRVLGGHPDEVFEADMLVISPGVNLEMAQIRHAMARGVAVIGELELGSGVLGDCSKEALPIVAVTGSNGKSTTTTLVDYMIRKAGFNTILGGNIGSALTEEILKISNFKNGKCEILGVDFAVLEVSSFQLESITGFRPHIAALLNVTPDHMDRYHSPADYSSAKARIFVNQRETDYLVLNADDPEAMKIKKEIWERGAGKPKIIHFSRSGKAEGMYLKDNVVYANSSLFRLPALHFPLISANEIRIKGVHNLENAMAASAMALLANCPPGAVIEALREFPGLEHRLEFVRELDGVKYINDSKGTNVGAVIKSLESFSEPLILIAGGRDKAGDFTVLKKLVSEKVRSLVLIGEAAGKIKEALAGSTEICMARDMEDAVAISRKKAPRGGVVLLSPACASFDMFRDFEDRGRSFRKIVMDLR